MTLHLNHAEPKQVYKGWGGETWHVLSKDFCVKTISILKSHRTSFQWHRQKEEINFIRSGEAEVWMEDETGQIVKHVLKPGDSFFVPATRKHRVVALTDLEMFEVSNEFVDDVVRIDDEFGRGDGKIEAEHLTPRVLILAAGLGSRLKHLTATKNKALIPLGEKAVISHIIEQFPVQYEIVVALGYEWGSLADYLQMAHPERTFHLVKVQRWADPKTDPGHSAAQCSHLLQRPFYLTATDCLIDGPIPHLDGNWLGVSPTDLSEQYATVRVKMDDVVGVMQKGPAGYDQAFIGLAGVLDYRTFWAELAKSPTNELVAAWRNPSAYPTLRAKELRWFDTGNLDNLNAARRRFGGTTLSSSKSTDEVTYHVGNRLLKLHPDKQATRNRCERAATLRSLVADGLTCSDHVFANDWQSGRNLYQWDFLPIYRQFLAQFEQTLHDSSDIWFDHQLVRRFYEDKTRARLEQFSQRYGEHYLTTRFEINGINRPALAGLLERIDYTHLSDSPLYTLFHGDLHFDNLIWDEAKSRAVYIDWRESFGGETQGGDLYYDLGKLYAGCLVPFELLKHDASLTLSEGSTTVSYSYSISPALAQFTTEYEQWLTAWGYDLKKVRLVAALAFLNISPLHTDHWNKLLFFKGVELLDQTLSQP